MCLKLRFAQHSKSLLNECWTNRSGVLTGTNYRLFYELGHISLLFGGSIHLTFPFAYPVIADLPVSQLSPVSHVGIAKGHGQWLRRKHLCFSPLSTALETLTVFMSISGHGLCKDQEHLHR